MKHDEVKPAALLCHCWRQTQSSEQVNVLAAPMQKNSCIKSYINYFENNVMQTQKKCNVTFHKYQPVAFLFWAVLGLAFEV